MKKHNKEEIESLTKELASAKMGISVAENDRRQIGDMYKRLSAQYDELLERRIQLEDTGSSLATRCMELFCGGMVDDELCERYNKWRVLIVGKPDFSPKAGRKSK